METFLMVSSVCLRIRICADRGIAERDAEVPVSAVRGRLGRATEQCVIPSSLVGSRLLLTYHR